MSQNMTNQTKSDIKIPNKILGIKTRKNKKKTYLL